MAYNIFDDVPQAPAVQPTQATEGNIFADVPQASQGGGNVFADAPTANTQPVALRLDEAPESSVGGVLKAGIRQAAASAFEGLIRTPDTLTRILVDAPNDLIDRGLRSMGLDPKKYNPRVDVGLHTLSEKSAQTADAFNEWQARIKQNDPDAIALAQKGRQADEAVSQALDGDYTALGKVLTDPQAWAGFIGQGAPSLALAAATGGSIKAIAWLEGMSGANSAAAFEKRTGIKISPIEYAHAVGQIAVVNGLLEKIGLEQLLHGRGKNLLLTLLKNTTKEGGTEFLQNLNSNAAARGYDDSQQLLSGSLQSIIGGVGLGTAATPFTHYLGGEPPAPPPEPGPTPTPGPAPSGSPPPAPSGAADDSVDQIRSDEDVLAQFEQDMAQEVAKEPAGEAQPPTPTETSAETGKPAENPAATSLADQLAEVERLHGQATSAGVKEALRVEAERIKKKLAGKPLTGKERKAEQKRVDPTKDTIATAIQKLGGIDTELESDWAGRLQDRKDKIPGLPGLERPGNGRSLDDLAESLHELGYLKTADASELAEKLDRVEHGETVHSIARSEADMAAEHEESANAPRPGADIEARRQEATDADRSEFEQDLGEHLSRGEQLGDLYDESAYSGTESGNDRILHDIIEMANGVDADATESLVTQAEKNGDDNQSIARKLITEVINGKREKAAGNGAAPTEGITAQAPDEPGAKAKALSAEEVLTEAPSPAGVSAPGHTEELPPNTVSGGAKEIRSLVRFAKDGPANEKRAVSYGQVSAEQAARLKGEVGLDLEGFRHTADNFAIRHIFKQHGNAAKEARRGQEAVTPHDIARLPKVIESPDSVEDGGLSRQGKPIIRYRKRFNATTVVVEEVRTGRRELALLRLWKTRAAPDAPDTRSPAQTSATFGRNPPQDNHNSSTPAEPLKPAAQEQEQETQPAQEPVTTERRANTAERKRVGEMSPHEMRKALLVDDLTGLGNRRAYEEAEKLAVQVSIDADSLKWINDHMSPDAGDSLLKAIGEAIGAVTEQGYHISGDEFIVQADTREEAEAAVQAAVADLKNFVLEWTRPDGEVITKTGLEITYGIGADKAQADYQLKQEKQRREDAGQRAPRGEQPPGVVRVPTQRGHAQDSTQEAGGVTGPVKRSEPSANKRVFETGEQNLSDFGQKLFGARKDQAPSLAKELTDEDIASQPLSKIWPLKELDEINDPFAAAGAYAARAEIPAKPRKRYALARWVEKVKQVREIGRHAVEGRLTPKQLEERPGLGNFAAKVKLLQNIDRAQWPRVKEVRQYPGAIKYDNDGNQVPAPHVGVNIDNKWHLLDGAKSIDEAMDEAKALLETGKPAPRMQFEIRHNRRQNRYFINKKGDSEHRRLKEFDSVDAARAYLKDNHEQLVEAWEAVKERDNVTKDDMRRDDNRERSGPDYRNGKDVTPESFVDTFGFRGVEFGNWMKQGKNASDRQGMLNQAYDALMDLADIVGAPPRALSLNSTLGLGLGSRGKGGRTAAHFEPDRIVINLTKTRGAGSLAHEWFHALDNYFARMRGEPEFKGNQGEYRRRAFVTYRPENYYIHKTSGRAIPESVFDRLIEGERVEGYGRMNERARDRSQWQIVSGVRPEVGKAFSDLVQALDKAPMAKRAALLDKGQADGYWSRIIERAARSFENYVIVKMADKGIENDYLANVTTQSEFKRAAERYPYHRPDEMGPVTKAFDTLFNTIETRETENGNVAMYSRRSAQDKGRQLESLYEAATNDARLSKTMELRPVTPAEVEEARANGVNLKDYQHSVDSYALRHTRRKHGDNVTEASRGQLAITKEDIRRIPEVIDAPDEVIYGLKNKRGQDQIIYLKRFKDGSALYVTEARTGKRRLAMESMRKYPAATRASSTMKTLGLNVLNDGGDRVSIVARTNERKRSGAPTGQEGSGNPSAFAGTRSGAPPRRLSQQEVEKLARGVLGMDPIKARVSIVESFAELPDVVRRAVAADGVQDGDIKALHWRGRSWLLADQMGSPRQVEEAIYHEHYTHGGLRAKWGSELGPKLDSLIKGVGGIEGLRTMAGEQNIGLSDYESALADNPNIGERNKRRVLMEELLAHMSQATGRLKRTLQEWLGAVRDFLRRHGFAELARYNASDLAHVLRQARAAVQRQASARPTKPTYQRVFHGTPHRGIEQEGFKLQKIGTGEGAQAYGYGFYFASEKDIAESYRKALAGRVSAGSPRSSDSAYVTAARDFLKHEASPEETFTGLKHAYPSATEADLRLAIHEANPGQLYHAEIPQDSDLLHWDEPLSKQPGRVLAALRGSDILEQMRSWNHGGITFSDPMRLNGEGFYGALEREFGSARAASEYLNSLGIPGLRYKAGQLSDGKSDSHNYVIWDEAHLNSDVTPYYARTGRDVSDAQLRRELDAVPEVRDSEGRLLAPNGKPSNLNERQWKQVRTERFKRWFGDWQAAALSKVMRDTTGSELARKAASEFLGEPLTNGDITAIVSRASLNKMLSASAVKNSVSPQAHAMAVGNLDKLFPLALERVSRVPDRAGDQGRISAIHHFDAPMPFAGEVLRVKMLVKETTAPDQNNPLYTVAAVEIEKPVSTRGESASEEDRSPAPPTGFNHRFAQLVAAVNGEGVGKVVDENGEPMVAYHGTDADIEAFDSGFSTPRIQDQGFHFTTDTQRAGRFADSEHGNVMPVYLSVKNPLRASNPARFYQGLTKDLGKYATAEDVINWLEKQGHDGIQFGDDHFIVLRPEQIKSAGNRGSFDANDPRISYALGEPLAASDRSPWQADFPRAKILHSAHDVQQHKDYQAAKAGDAKAAYRLVRDTVSESDLARIAKAVGDRMPIVVGVHAEERTGLNKIPVILSERIAHDLGYDLDDGIIQAENVSRGGSSGFHRLANSPHFTGPVEAGRDYVIVDDTLAQGGTVAALKGYIENQGGRVILVSALMGKQYSATLAPTKGLLQEVRARYGEDFDGWWREHFGYGLDRLTQSELRYLATVSRPESVRDRILAARQARGDSGSSPNEGAGEGRHLKGESPRHHRTRPSAGFFDSESVTEPSFARESAPALFLPNAEAAAGFRERLRRSMQSQRTNIPPIEVIPMSAVLKSLGVRDVPIVVSRDVVRKATNGVKHDVPMSAIEHLPEELSDPLAVFRSATQKDAFVVLTEERDLSGHPVVIAMDVRATSQSYDVTRIATVYGRVGANPFLGWVRQGLLAYGSDRAATSPVLKGLQLPNSVSGNRGLSGTVLTEADVLSKSTSQGLRRASPAGPHAITAETARSHLGSVARGWKNRPPIIVVQSEAELPANLQQAIRHAGASGHVRGVWFNGKAYIVADMHGDLQGIEETLLHEVLGHHGLRGLLGEAIEPVMRDIYRAYRNHPKLLAIAKRYRLDLSNPTDQAVAGEEMLAHMVQTGERIGLLRRVIAKIRAFLKAHFPRLNLDWSDSDIWALIERARTHVTEGGIVAGEPISAPRFSLGPDTIAGRAPNGEMTAAARLQGGKWHLIIYKGGNGELFEGGKRRFTLGTAAEVMAKLEQHGLIGDYSEPRSTSLRARPLFEDGFTVPSDTLKDKIIYALQDRFIDLRRIQGAVRASTNGKIDEASDAYLREALYYGRAEKRIRDFRDRHVEPLLKKVKDLGLTLEEVNDYLYARHAVERNAEMSSINPQLAEGEGSGMTDAEAQMVMESLADKISSLERVAADVDRIIEKSRRLMVNSGLEREETVLAWESTYEHYVPLRGFEEAEHDPDQGSPAIRGSGFDVRGRDRAALGRRSRAANILVNVMAQYEATAVRAEKNRIGQSLMRLVQANPNPALWQINPVEYRPRRDPKTGLVMQSRDMSYRTAANELTVKVSGKDHHIVFKGERGERMAKALKNLDMKNQGKVFSALHRASRVLAALYTTFSPEFILTNFTRDIQTAALNLSNTEIHGAATKIWRRVPFAMAGIVAGKFDGDTQWARHFDEFERAGGKTGWIDAHQNLEDVKRQIERYALELKRGKFDPRELIKKGARTLGGGVVAANEVVENGVRLSAFVTARELGMSVDQAAYLAKNLTVNFNRRGAAGPYINALYLFFNASMQGSARLLQALASRRGRKMAAAMALVAVGMSLLNRLICNKGYEDIPSWEKERNWIFMTPDCDHIKIPLPYGWNVFKVVGEQAGDFMASQLGMAPAFSSAEALQAIGTAAVGAFNPLGAEITLPGQLISPTLTDPIVQIGNNKDFAGRPIYKEPNPFELAPSPDSQLHWDATYPIAIAVADALNKYTGGSDARPGGIDISPDTLEHITEYYGGGVAKFAINASTSIWDWLIKGESVPAYKIPFARRFYGTPYARSDLDALYDNARSIEYAVKDLEAARGKRDYKGVADIRQEYGPELRLANLSERTRKQVSRLRKEIKRIERADLPEARKKERSERLQERMNNLVERFNSEYEQAVLH